MQRLEKPPGKNQYQEFSFALSDSSLLMVQLLGKVFSKHTVSSAGLTWRKETAWKIYAYLGG
jgi:hypothetical protein